MTTTEAAALIGTARRNVQNYCKRHALPKRGRDYDISDRDIEGMRNELGKPGRKATGMNTRELAQQARAMVADGTAKSLAEAIGIVTRAALDEIAGTYTARAERDWIEDVTRVEQATR